MAWFAILTILLSVQQAERRTADDYACLLGGDCPAARSAAEPQGRFMLVPAPVDLRLSFAAGSAALTPAAKAEARSIASALTRPSLTARRLRIEGHTDSIGSRASNVRLSRQRAEAVVTYLVRQGVARTRLVAIGHGFDRPLPGRSASAPENRRVVAVVMP